MTSPRSNEFDFSNILHELPVAFCFCDSDGKLQLFNRAFVQLIALEEGDLLNRTLKEVLPNEAKSVWKERNEMLLSPGCTQNFEIVLGGDIKCKSYWKVSRRCSFSESGQLQGCVSIFTDITRSKLEQEERLTEHELLRTLVDAMPALIYAKDTKNRFILANDGVAKHMGAVVPENLIGKTDFDFYSKDFADEFYADEKRVFSHREPVVNKIERSVDASKGEFRWLSSTKVPLITQDDELIGLVGIGLDVTREKRLLDRLNELNDIVDNSGTMAFLVHADEDWSVHFCNQTIEEFGYQPDDFLEKRLGFSKIVNPEDFEEMKSVTITNFENGIDTFTLDYRIRRKDGTLCWVEDQKFLRGKTDSGIFIFQSLIRDVSKRYKMQAERDQMEMELRQAQKLESVGQLAAGIAHEINTPIQFVRDNLQFLSDSIDDLQSLISTAFHALQADDPVSCNLRSLLEKKAKELDLEYLAEEVPTAIEQSISGIDSVRDIVTAMKEFSTSGDGGIYPEDINTAILNTITVARNEWQCIAELETHLDSSIESVPVDIGPMKQSILDLIVNAAHAIESMVQNSGMRRGRINVTSQLKDDHILISVSDNGIGMDEDTKSRVFDPFFTKKEIGKGLGQGLALAYDIVVRKHGGALYVESELGKGSTFHIELPLVHNSTA